MFLQECMPPQQISPSAANLSPKSAATSQALWNVSTINFELPFGSFAQSATPAAESIRIMPLGRIPILRNSAPISQERRTMSTKVSRASLSPIAFPAQIGATKLPISNPCAATLSAKAFAPSLPLSMSKCGGNKPISTPSNFTPSTSAAAVMANMLSNEITGSESGPFPTIPGHVALCNFG